jgi:cytochrome c551/c552
MTSRLTMVIADALFIVLLTATGAAAEDGKELFQTKCAGCHTIGGGDGAGPDLKGVAQQRKAEWLVRMITEPDKLSAEKDPTQLSLVKKYGMQMPSLGVSRDDAQKIITFLQGGAAPAAKGGAPAAAPPPPVPAQVTPQLVATGRALFTGNTSFAKGGAPCVACHDFSDAGVYGGGLAANLSAPYQGMGATGMRSVLGSLSFPVMRTVYADRPLDEGEKNALLAFFQDASARKQGVFNPYPLVAAGFFVIFVIAAVLLKRRIR